MCKNMKHRILILLTCICFPLLGNAQVVLNSETYTHYGGTFTSGITVNNLEIGKVYTQSEVISAIDTPTLYYSYESEFGLGEVYKYENGCFSFTENGMFIGFFIDSDDFVVFEQYDGGIRVGDPITKVTELGIEGILQVQQNPSGGLVIKQPIKPTVLSTTIEVYEFWMYDEVMIFNTELGQIVSISYSSSL